MNDEQLERAVNHVKENWGDKGCPCCGNNSWGIKDNLATTPLWNSENKTVSLGISYSFVVAECDNCQYCLFFEAKNSGIL